MYVLVSCEGVPEAGARFQHVHIRAPELFPQALNDLAELNLPRCKS